MACHLAAISRAVPPGAHAVVLLDRAGRHTTSRLAIPGNITLMPLPPRAPELNPAENLWQFMRDNGLSNRVFQSHDDILDYASNTWRKIEAQPWRIMSIGLRQSDHGF